MRPQPYGKVSVLVSLAVVTASSLLGVTATQAAAHKFGGGVAKLQFGRVNAPAAYDPFWKIKDPGGPVELNPQPLPPRYLGQGVVNPGVIAGYLNPQPDPPGFE